MHKKTGNAVLGIALLVAVLGWAGWRLVAPLFHQGVCNLSSRTCPLSVGGHELEVELRPRRPAPGEELRLVLKSTAGPTDELAGEQIVVEFSMPGMEMGEHIMRLASTEPGTMEGRIALPACPMGHSLWQASIRIGQAPAGELVLHVGP